MKVFSSSILLGLIGRLIGSQSLLCLAFCPPPPLPRAGLTTTRPTSCLAGTVTTSTPSQAECEALGVREWPQQIKKGAWTEEVAPDAELVRYVLEGQGTLVVTDDDTTDPKQQQQQSLQPGTMVTVTGPATLEWQASTKDMILLTPSYEQGGLLVAVGAGLVVLMAALIAATSS